MKKILATMALLLGIGTTAQATIIISDPVISTTTLTGDTFTYTISFDNTLNNRRITNGDFFVLYDVGPVVSAVFSNVTFTLSFENTNPGTPIVGSGGPTEFTPSASQDTDLQDIVLTRNISPNITTSQVLGTLTVVVPYPTTGILADQDLKTMAAQTRRLTTATRESNITAYSAPTPISEIPEPTTFALMGAGLIGLALFGRRR